MIKMKDKIIAYLMKRMRIEVAVAGIIAKGNKILLEKRSRSLVEGNKWALPGGHVEKWEKAEEAMKRELKEETGLSTKKAKLLFVHEEFVKRLNLHAVVFVYQLESTGKEKANWEVSEMKYFTRSEIEKIGLAFTHKEILNKFWSKK